MNEKNVQEALGFLGDDLIEKGEFDMMQRKNIPASGVAF